MPCSVYVLLVTVSCVRWTNIPEIWERPEIPGAKMLTWRTFTLVMHNCKVPLYKIVTQATWPAHLAYVIAGQHNSSCKIKVKCISQTQLYFIKNIILCSYMFWVLVNRHTFVQNFKIQKLFKLLAVYLNEISLILCSENVNTLTLICSTCAFFFFPFLILFQMLCLNENMLLIKLRCIIDMNIQSLHMNT